MSRLSHATGSFLRHDAVTVVDAVVLAFVLALAAGPVLAMLSAAARALGPPP